MFVVGGRYRNRIGWFEVLELNGSELTVLYEHDGSIQTFDVARLRRIVENIAREEAEVTPYSVDNDERNVRYFKTLGYLANRGFIEAIIPPKAKPGFDRYFRSIKGRNPYSDEKGYYVHHDPGVDKWGTEMRLTFKIPSEFPEYELDFGDGVRTVDSPNDDERRINSNTLCWNLLILGFELGAEHRIEEIASMIPERYREAFREGTNIV